MLSHYIAVGLGGGLGAISRVLLGKILPSTIITLPTQILVVNILGCLIMGLLTEIMISWHPSDHMRYFLIPGFLGGFTTFSSFALEFGFLYEKDLYISAILYATLSIFLSLAGFFIGVKIIRMFF